MLQNKFWVVLEEVNFEFLREFVEHSLEVKNLLSILYLSRCTRT